MGLEIKLPPPIHPIRALDISLDSFVADYMTSVPPALRKLAERFAGAKQSMKEEWDDLLTAEQIAEQPGESADEMCAKFMRLADSYMAYRVQNITPQTEIAKRTWWMNKHPVSCNFDSEVESFIGCYRKRPSAEMIQKVTAIVDEFLDGKFPERFPDKIGLH